MTRPTSFGELLRASEAARVLNVTRQTLTRWRREGTGPAYVMLTAAHARYRLEDLEAWAARHQPRKQPITQAKRPEPCGCNPDASPHRWDAFSYCAEHHHLSRWGRLGGSAPRWLSVEFEVPTNAGGYCKVKTAAGRSTIASQVIWKCLHGSDSIPPGHVIDFRDCDRLNVRPENLRCVTRSEDAWNRSINTHHPLPKGVARTRRGTFAGRVGKHRRATSRSFATAELAEDFVRSLREDLHGEYHRHGSPGTRWTRRGSDGNP